MDKDLHNIEDLFKSALEDNEEMPSAKLWDAVDNRLDKDNVTAIKKKYKTLKRLSLLLLLLLIGLSIYELNIRPANNGQAKTNSGGSDKESALGNKNDNAVQANNNGTSKEQTDSKDLNNNTTVNTIRSNSIADKNTRGKNVPVQPGNNLNADKSDNNFNTDKQNQKRIPADAKAIINGPSAFQIHPSLIKKSKQQETKIAEPVKDEQNATTNNSSVQTNNHLPFARQLNLLPVEKTNKVIADSFDTKKLLQSLAANKTIPPIDTKIAVSQQTKKKETKPSRFSITGFFSPDIASYSLEDDDIGNQPDNANQIKKNERHEFSSTSGLLIDYALNKHWSLQSGLTFSNTNIAIEPKTIYAKADNNGNVKYRLNFSSGYGYLVPSFQPSPSVGDTLKVTATTHKLRYIGIPVAIKYRIVKGKLIIEAMAGVTSNFLTTGKLETEIQRGANNEIDILNKIEGLKSIYLSGMAGIGAEYRLTGKLSVTLMPTARFALNPINKGAVVKTFPNSFGLTAGLKIKL